MLTRSGERAAMTLLAHEIIHALGVTYHVNSRHSIMYRGVVHGSGQPLSILYPLDRAVIYHNPSEYELGPWNGEALHLVGTGDHVAFGVALRNGYAEPWAYGHKPDRDLASNPELSGTVTWAGALLGLTPDAAAVAGDAAIGVDLAELTGTAAFTALESWAAGTAPGEAGTGTMWLDGDLGYIIAVRGNTFRETGGDDCRLTGIFTGASHEGAAGTLERVDLTAAFGGSR